MAQWVPGGCEVAQAVVEPVLMEAPAGERCGPEQDDWEKAEELVLEGRPASRPTKGNKPNALPQAMVEQWGPVVVDSPDGCSCGLPADDWAAAEEMVLDQPSVHVCCGPVGLRGGAVPDTGSPGTACQGLRGGFDNPGTHTCYLNSALQALLHSDRVRGVLSMHLQCRNTCASHLLARAMQATDDVQNFGRTGYFKPWLGGQGFAWRQQHDVGEVLACLVRCVAASHGHEHMAWRALLQVARLEELQVVCAKGCAPSVIGQQHVQDFFAHVSAAVAEGSMSTTLEDLLRSEPNERRRNSEGAMVVSTAGAKAQRGSV